MFGAISLYTFIIVTLDKAKVRLKKKNCRKNIYDLIVG